MFKEYGELSTILYEHTKPVGYSINGDIEYYSGKLKNLTGRMLEAGVGTGRMLIPFVKSGMTIDGVDISAEMLSQCKTNMKMHSVTAELYEQDLIALSLPHKYDAIIMPTGTFCLLPRECIQDVLTLFYKHLNVGGKIMIDLEMPSHFKEGAVSTSSFQISDDTGILLSEANGKIDWVAQKTTSISKYELIEKGEVTKTEISNFTLYWYGIAEFEMRLALLGYKDIEYKVGYGNKQSDIITFTAFKTNGDS